MIDRPIKTLLAGCSFSDWCGFGAPVQRDGKPAMGLIGNKNDQRCWYNVVKKNCNLDLNNVSYGGYSNEEILFQITKNLALDDGYQMVIIQLSSTGRKWFYRSNDPFDFVLLHGENSQNPTEKKLLEYLRVYLHNELVETEKTLSSLLLIQHYLKEKKIPLLLINGADFGHVLRQLIHNAENFCRQQISNDIWDYKGKNYAQQLSALAKQLDLDNFLFLDESLFELAIDTADDQMHPGEKSNLLYAEIISKKILEISQAM